MRAELPLRLTEKLEPDIFYQLVKVLRVSPGDKVVLMAASSAATVVNAGVGHTTGEEAMNRGDEFLYEVESAQKKEIVLRFKERAKNQNELDFRLELLLCLPNKPDKLEMILQKAVEIGAAAVTIVEGDFSRMKHNLRNERLAKIMTEAAEQSERAYVPELAVKSGLRAYLSGLGEEEKSRIFVAMERGADTLGLPVLLTRRKAASVHKGTDVTILIGPEGGFSPEEKAMIEKLKFPCFSLGRRILRMETAAIVSLGMAASFTHPPFLQ